MAQSFHNIEKLPGKDYYTGYAEGAIYRIRRVNNKWRGAYMGEDRPVNTPLWFYERTMREVSAMLENIGAARSDAAKNAAMIEVTE